MSDATNIDVHKLRACVKLELPEHLFTGYAYFTPHIPQRLRCYRTISEIAQHGQTRTVCDMDIPSLHLQILCSMMTGFIKPVSFRGL